MIDPWFSVVMPLHNAGRYLRQALDSLLAQGDPGIEVVAVEQGSADDTLEILRQYESRLPLRVFRLDAPCNWVVKTNVGIRAARAPWIGFLHHDDYWLPGRAVRVRAHLERKPSTALLFHPTWFVDQDRRRIGLFLPPIGRSRNWIPAAALLERLLIQDFISVPAAVFSRSALEEVGLMDEPLWYSSDWDLMLKVGALGRSIHEPAPLVSYRIHPLSLTSLQTAASDDYRSQQERVLERHLRIWEGRGMRFTSVRPIARFSVALNVAFSMWAHGRPAGLTAIALRFLGLGPEGWYRYLRDSRIVARSAARLRVRLWNRRK